MTAQKTGNLTEGGGAAQPQSGEAGGGGGTTYAHVHRKTDALLKLTI